MIALPHAVAALQACIEQPESINVAGGWEGGAEREASLGASPLGASSPRFASQRHSTDCAPPQLQHSDALLPTPGAPAPPLLPPDLPLRPSGVCCSAMLPHHTQNPCAPFEMWRSQGLPHPFVTACREVASKLRPQNHTPSSARFRPYMQAAYTEAAVQAAHIWRQQPPGAKVCERSAGQRSNLEAEG